MSLHQSVRLEVFERDGYRCRYCGVRYVNKVTREPVASKPYDGPFWMRRQRWIGLLHVDHVIPRCKGGTDDLDNLVTACGPCNLQKYDRIWKPRQLEAVG